ncbi:uncharacterized protein MONOS_13825 [Monocercomonoides exilis]|uniref:uncharacterized protein n=1 Tax=Monocercomonoides exilis TaxID=2049356 RepID=UPI003559C2FA|nr:hypothetical protein MONOS_13825 [Monocercomonoides exilis]|eukprot:MONOS_13825.1-p1 / transcript=MONOS_13825.1 / gene=MONOS_13825 / organism=Monocercomonoides_exilis_PA203 / gene_product=unspecified product / transcript_product=unspecified product / location=Mono_scaffold00890:3026-4473(-) / protein_length=442 / sequence_SO=supercontig / SO=protein_coding / is_pseudo=false
MEICDEDKSNDDIQEPSLEDKFSKLFCELEHCNEDVQRKKKEEMNKIVDGVNKEEFKSVFNTELYDKIFKMIEEKKMTMENAILLLKHVGYCKVLKNVWNPCFDFSSLGEKFKKMVIEEEKKKEEKNKGLLIDLCECYIFLSCSFTHELLSICLSCLLKFALKKEESEETRKEKEMVLLALSEIGYCNLKQELYLKEITEIIQYHQSRHNLTRFAYQCAWRFLIYRFIKDRNLEDTVSNELHFGREATGELEELTKCVNWKKKEEEMSKEEANEVLIIKRWIETFSICLRYCSLQNEEYVVLFSSISYVYLAAKDDYSIISYRCISSLRNAAKNKDVKVEDLLKGGAVEAVLEEMQRPIIEEEMTSDCFEFFKNVSIKLKEKEDNKMEEEERKTTKRKIFDKMEEEGYEDTIITFHETLKILNRRYYYELSLKISDYLVNI